MTLRTQRLTPETGLADYIEDIAHLRIEVFRDWPYLYDGDLDYERQYMREFTKAPGAVAVIAFDGDRVVGAATGMPLSQAQAAFRKPFTDAGMDIARLFYCAESVLKPAYRGNGLYRAFFDGREGHARAQGGFDATVFCGVERPADHPLKPKGAGDLAPVWRHFGYEHRPALFCRLGWKDVDQDDETEKTLSFWYKHL